MSFGRQHYRTPPCGHFAAALLLAVSTTVTVAADDKKDLYPPCESVESIGAAQMATDGVITLRIRSLPPGPIAEGELRYAPGDPQYDEIKRHLGGISPGESKSVKPWC
jgi:hypothetical protein